MKNKRIIAFMMAAALCISCAGCGNSKAEYTTDKSLSLTFNNSKTLYFGETRSDIEKDFGAGKDITFGIEYDVGKTMLTIGYRDNKTVCISTNSGTDGKSGLGVSVGDDSSKVTAALGKPIKSSSLGDEYIFVKGKDNNILLYSKTLDDIKKALASCSDKELENYIDVTIQSHDGKVVNISYMDYLFGMKNK